MREEAGLLLNQLNPNHHLMVAVVVVVVVVVVVDLAIEWSLSLLG
jgi:hypothetical protein